MIIQGPVVRMGEDINTDDIIPARYLTTADPKELAEHLFEDMAEEVVIPENGIIIAGENFGSGSSREHAPIGLKGAGIQIVLAESLARIFARNCINIGLLAVEAPGITRIADTESVSVDLEAGTITPADGSEPVEILPVPEFLYQLIDAGGLIPWIKAGGMG